LPDDEPLNELAPPTAPIRSAPLVAGDPCPYCGAVLVRSYYFCTVCATPYVDENSVLPRLRPAVPTIGELMDRKAPGVKKLFWTYFSVIAAGVVAVSFFLGREHIGAISIVFDAVLLLVTAGFATSHGGTLKPALMRIGFLRWEAWAGVASVVPLLLLNYAYTWFLLQLIGGTHVRRPFSELEDAGFSHAALIFSLAIFPALSEEVAFRGLMQPWLTVAIGPRKAILISGALFAALHFNVLGFPYLLLVGMVLGWLRWKTASLYPSIVLHFLHNFGVIELFPG
jgi:membrane protease YdiL (CAAX protease family)